MAVCVFISTPTPLLPVHWESLPSMCLNTVHTAYLAHRALAPLDSCSGKSCYASDRDSHCRILLQITVLWQGGLNTRNTQIRDVHFLNFFLFINNLEKIYSEVRKLLENLYFFRITAFILTFTFQPYHLIAPKWRWHIYLDFDQLLAGVCNTLHTTFLTSRVDNHWPIAGLSEFVLSVGRD